MYHLRAVLNRYLLAIIILNLPAINSANADTNTNVIWNGVWFTCEFSNRTKAPDDGCYMFDNEGFRVTDGIFSYLKVINSTEKQCRGNKTGHCFKSDEEDIIVKESPIGKIDIQPDHLFVRYLGCKQRFSFQETTDFFAVIPDEKKCFWASKRHFYVARYNGDLSVTK
jgi:hypothetical protein